MFRFLGLVVLCLGIGCPMQELGSLQCTLSLMYTVQ